MQLKSEIFVTLGRELQTNYKLKMTLTLVERVKIVLLSGRQGCCVQLKSKIFVTLGRELQTVVLLSITIC
jgi:hypothetical protein